MINVPSEYTSIKEWLLIGPMGPELSSSLKHLPIICVDGGSQFTQDATIWIGDGDSGKIPQDHPATFIYPRDKDHSDLSLALSILITSEAQTLHLWGFFGGRTDHFLANLGEIHHFLNQKPSTKIIFYDDQGTPKTTVLSKGEWTLNINSLFSVFMLEKANISIIGACKYQIPSSVELRPLSSLGLSNSGQGEVKMTSSGPFFVIQEREL